MPLRIHSLIRIIALCKFNFGLFVVKRALKFFTGAEMGIHAGIFALMSAGMLVQRAGGERSQTQISCNQTLTQHLLAYEILQFLMNIGVMFIILVLCVSLTLFARGEPRHNVI